MTAEAPLADPPRPGADPASAGPLLDQQFDADTLHPLRAAVLAHAARAGLPRDRVGDVMIAVHELAANTVRHGAGAGQLVISTEPGALQCQVFDAGAAGPDGRADGTGDSPPPWPSPEGHGLWLVRQIADQLSIARWHGGYRMTAHFTLPAQADARAGLRPWLGGGLFPDGDQLAHADKLQDHGYWPLRTQEQQAAAAFVQGPGRREEHVDGRRISKGQPGRIDGQVPGAAGQLGVDQLAQLRGVSDVGLAGQRDQRPALSGRH